MELTTIENTIRDTQKRVTCIVLAYRTLTREDIVQAVRMHNASAKTKPKARSTIRIVSSLGASQ